MHCGDAIILFLEDVKMRLISSKNLFLKFYIGKINANIASKKGDRRKTIPITTKTVPKTISGKHGKKNFTVRKDTCEYFKYSWLS